jgi:hypothetical protein
LTDNTDSTIKDVLTAEAFDHWLNDHKVELRVVSKGIAEMLERCKQYDVEPTVILVALQGMVETMSIDMDFDEAAYGILDFYADRYATLLRNEGEKMEKNQTRGGLPGVLIIHHGKDLT